LKTRLKKTRPNKKIERGRDSIQSERALKPVCAREPTGQKIRKAHAACSLPEHLPVKAHESLALRPAIQALRAGGAPRHVLECDLGLNWACPIVFVSI
jgi:hypothetical protein